jgi:uncharacterized protein YdeI (YjbR/CyaY-like superfamily)
VRLRVARDLPCGVPAAGGRAAGGVPGALRAGGLGGRARVGYDASVEEALCFGWVDSKVNALDAERSLPWFAPRGPRTGWSAPNKDRVERMIASGLMTAAGLAKVEAAKADGSWSKLDAVEALQVPEELAAALAAHPPAATPWDACPRGA